MDSSISSRSSNFSLKIGLWYRTKIVFKNIKFKIHNYFLHELEYLGRKEDVKPSFFSFIFILKQPIFKIIKFFKYNILSIFQYDFSPELEDGKIFKWDSRTNTKVTPKMNPVLPDTNFSPNFIIQIHNFCSFMMEKFKSILYCL